MRKKWEIKLTCYQRLTQPSPVLVLNVKKWLQTVRRYRLLLAALDLVIIKHVITATLAIYWTSAIYQKESDRSNIIVRLLPAPPYILVITGGHVLK